MTDNKQNDPTVEDYPRVIAGSLDLVDVTKTYAGRRGTSQKAVDGISLHIKAGTFTTLLGPSGCGKTTTLRMIAGFEEVTSGEITLDGEPLTSTPANKRPMSMVFQSYALFSHLTVEENVGFGLKLKKVARQERDDRVATSLRTEALIMSDTIVVMSAGRIEQVGTPAEIYPAPRTASWPDSWARATSSRARSQKSSTRTRTTAATGSPRRSETSSATASPAWRRRRAQPS